MVGHIRRRGQGVWEISWEIEADGTTGRRRRRWKVVRGTKRDAERALAGAIHRQTAGTDLTPSTATVSHLLNRFLHDVASIRVRPSTLRRYSEFSANLQESLGSIRLQALQAPRIQAAYAKMLNSGSAPRTVLHHHRFLRQALTQSIRWGLLAANPTDGVTPPKPVRAEIRTLSTDEVAALIEACDDLALRALVGVAVTTGMRQGELLGLRWSDVDLERGRIRIQRSLRYLGHAGFVFQEPKTARSRRTVAPSAETLVLLREHRMRQLEQRMRLGPAYADQGLVFPREDGRPQVSSRVSHQFRSLTERVGVNPCRFHDLRHTAATLMLTANVHPKIVSDTLGHSTVTTTLDTYSHVIPSLQESVANALEGILNIPGESAAAN